MRHIAGWSNRRLSFFKPIRDIVGVDINVILERSESKLDKIDAVRNAVRKAVDVRG